MENGPFIDSESVKFLDTTTFGDQCSVDIQGPPKNGFVIKETSDGTLITTQNNRELIDEFLKTRFWQEPEDSFVGGGTRRGYIVGTDGGNSYIVKNKLPASRMKESLVFAERFGSSQFDKRILRIQNSIKHEIVAINEAKKRYKEAFGKELSTEEPLCGFIDKRRKKTIAYKYIPDEIKDLSLETDRERVDWEQRIVQELESVGVHAYESHAIVVKDNTFETKGYRFVLVDAEKWVVDKQSV
jgi:hypothetical protein